jgi:hypothetical protein
MEVSMKKAIMACATLILVLSAYDVRGQSVMPELAASLSVSLRPAAVTASFTRRHELNSLNTTLEQMQEQTDSFLGYAAGYRELHFPADPKTYLMLTWSYPEGLFWRLLSSSDGKSYQVVQDSNAWYAGTQDLTGFRLRAQDLDGDGVPELLLYQGNFDMPLLYVFAWRGGQLVLISPIDSQNTSGYSKPLPTVYSALSSYHNNIILEDLDGDGKAEIIVYPGLDRVPDAGSTNPTTYHTEQLTPTRINKLQNGSYTLWKEIPINTPMPVLVHAIAVVHPGTIPLSELASSKGNSSLRVFVNHPAGNYTVDNLLTTGLTLDIGTAPVTFVKRWANQKQPDLTSANAAWEGCPVKETQQQSKGTWNVSPEDPTYPSPHDGMEFHFLGPYLELSVAKSAVYPFLLQRANADFAKDATLTTTFIGVPISGKMTDGKLAVITAMVCVQKTGSGK